MLFIYKKKAFTLIEIVVAIAILAVVILFAGIIFRESIDSYRTASAQAEIMQKLRVITEQLKSDFKGLQKDAPLFIWFDQNEVTPSQRYDQIMFFAIGDFQSSQTYSIETDPTSPFHNFKVPKSTGSPVVSNLARIYYGQAKGIDSRTKSINDPDKLIGRDCILARRQHLSVANPNPPQTQFAHYPQFGSDKKLIMNLAIEDKFEHDTNSLSQWQALINNPENVNMLIGVCFGGSGENRPTVNASDANTLHLLMIEGVGSFSVQWSYKSTLPDNRILWWPSSDPDGDGTINNPNDFNFYYLLNDPMGFFFNSVKPDMLWHSYDKANGPYYPADKPIYPQALKFTFTLYDSRGIFKDGQTFTHIVYLGD